MASATITLGTVSAEVSPQSPTVLIGRAENCDLVTEAPGVSRRHAEVFLQGEQLFIRDLGSSNGTWVEGQYADGTQAITPGQQIFVAGTPLLVEFTTGPEKGATVMVTDMPAVIAQAMAARKQQMAAMQAAGTGVSAPVVQGAAPAPVAGSPAQHSQQATGTFAPNPADFPYRKQGSNNNGVVLVALRKDTFGNDEVLDGYVEFTATDNETIASITCELVEVHRKGRKKGHVWDRVIVRQGPWKARKGDVLPMPIQLRVPSGTSMSGRDCHWEVRAYVDIEWAFDIACDCPINMRNADIEKLRDALGTLDYRLNEIASDPLGQHFSGSFQPPANLIRDIGIKDIALDVTYLGTNLKVEMTVSRKGMFKGNRASEFVIPISQLRTSTPQQVAGYYQNAINELLSE